VTSSGDPNLRGSQREIALVTGSASGIGAAIAERLSADYEVVGFDLDDGDLTTREGNRAAIDAAVAAGPLEVVVANAGVQHVSPVEDFPEDKWDQLIALMLTSPFLLAKYAWPALRETRGRFIAVSSVHGLIASRDKTAYIAAKHGVLGLVKTLALEGAEHGITATAICPGWVRTPLAEAQVAEKGDELLAVQPVQEFIEPAEVAEAVAFLCRTRAITGAPLVMDQGWTAR
jgi:3-hydroxybutyrate dehydrogenase